MAQCNCISKSKISGKLLNIFMLPHVIMCKKILFCRIYLRVKNLYLMAIIKTAVQILNYIKFKQFKIKNVCRVYIHLRIFTLHIFSSWADYFVQWFITFYYWHEKSFFFSWFFNEIYHKLCFWRLSLVLLRLRPKRCSVAVVMSRV